MLKSVYNRVHIRLYEDIIKGIYNPTHSRYSNPDILRGLVEEAGTIRIAILNLDDKPQDFIDNADFELYGYKSLLDFDLDIRPLDNGKNEIFIKPTRVYELAELIDLPYYNSLKCITFLRLMGDEFERIKIRAERFFDLADNDHHTRIYANKHVQKAKKLFHDSKQMLSNVRKIDNAEDIYIMFALNIFLIRTILFYQKMFKPYHSGSIDIEETLFHEVIGELTLKKLCSLFPSVKTGYCGDIKKSLAEKSGDTEDLALETIIDALKDQNTKKSLAEKSGDTEGLALETITDAQKDQNTKKSFPASKGELAYTPLQWNGQINVLVDILTQLTEDTKIDGKVALETTEENLLNFILANFRGSDNKELSYYTISTLLKKSRTDKRLHPQSPKKIDVSKNIKRKK